MLKISGKQINQIRFNNEDIGLAKLNGKIVFNKANSTLQVTFENEILKFSNIKSGTYDFYYADQNGILTDYEKICTLNLAQSNQYTYFNSLNVAPETAERVVACTTGTTTVVAGTSLPASLKISNLGNKKYSVGLLSDIHVDGDGTDEAYSQEDFTRALNFFKDKVSFIGICGDIACSYDNNADYTIYKSLIQNYSLPIQAISGNHDVNLDFISALGINNCNKYIYQNDVYLFLSCMAESSRNPIQADQIAWLTTELENYKNQRVFLFFHFFVNPVRKC